LVDSGASYPGYRTKLGVIEIEKANRIVVNSCQVVFMVFRYLPIQFLFRRFDRLSSHFSKTKNVSSGQFLALRQAAIDHVESAYVFDFGYRTQLPIQK
jgi:hypothetical protein